MVLMVKTDSESPKLLKYTQRDKIGFSSKSGQNYIETMTKFRSVLNQMKQILKDGRGAAFHAVPDTGSIKPWGEVEIKVSSYNNLVGIYKDMIELQVADTKQTFQVRLGVIGTPVQVSGAHLISREKEVAKGGINVEKMNFGSRVMDPTYGPCDGVRIVQKEKPISNSQKVIMVDNHSPRDVILDWKVYIKHLQSTPECGTSVDMIVRPENLVSADEIGVFAVYPSKMCIPAFKSAQLKCFFRNALLGDYEALVMADVAYVQSDGSLKYAPKRALTPGKWPSEEPIPPEMLRSGKVTLQDLESVAIFGIKAKCIEPKLTLEGSEFIKMKKSREKHSVIAFIDNKSDAICEFTLTASPSCFRVKGSKKHIVNKEGPIYELRQTQQLMITVEYVPEIKPTIQKRRKSDVSITEVSGRRGSLRSPSQERIADDKASSRRNSNTVIPEIKVSGSAEGIEEDVIIRRASLKKSAPALKGFIKIAYSNGMTQDLKIILERV